MLAKLLLINLVIYCANADGLENSDHTAMQEDLSQNQQNDQTFSKVESPENTYRPGIDVKLENHFNGYYTGEIIVGTAASGKEDQKISVIFDTGSVDLWIPSAAACATGGVVCDDTDESHKGFDASKSSTFRSFNQPYVTKYEDGLDAKGYAATDVLKIRSGQSEVLVPKLAFAVVEKAGADNDRADGIFGLGFGSQSSLYGSDMESPFQSMVRQANLKPQFGFFFNNRRDPDDDKSGHLFLGGYDESLVESEFTFAEVFRTSFFCTSWEVTMDRVTVEGSPVGLSEGVRTLLDSGSASIFFSSPLYESMFNQMPKEYASTLRENSFDCKAIDLAKLPKVTFIINKTPFELDPADYIEGEEAQPKSIPALDYDFKPSCFFLLKDMPLEFEENSINLGVPFMRKFYTLFDIEKKEIGFARARHRPKDDNVATETSRRSKSPAVSNTNVSEKPITSSKSKPKSSKSQHHSEVRGKDKERHFFERHSFLRRLFGISNRR